MAYDYFTVLALADEMNAALAGHAIRAANTRGAVLFFQSEVAGVLAECRREGTLRLLDSPPKGNRTVQGQGAERYLTGSKICSVDIVGRDRSIRLQLERTNTSGETSHGALVFELLNNHLVAALVSERTGEILGAWGGQERIAVGKQYEPPQGPSRYAPGLDKWADCWAQIKASEVQTVGEACRIFFVGLDRQQQEELFYRARLDAKDPVEEESLRALWQSGEVFCREALSQGGYSYRIKNRWHFSALEPQRVEPGTMVQHGTLSAMIRHAGEENRQCAKAKQRADRIGQALRRALQSCQRRLAAMRDDLEQAASAGDVEQNGHILMAQLDAVPAGASSVELSNVFDASGLERCTISLDPLLSPAENAAFLLKKAHKFRRRSQLLPPRIALEEKREKDLMVQMALFERGEDKYDEVVAWLENNNLMKIEERGGRGTDKPSQHKGAEAHPRQYVTSDGWSVWAGRNNKENDLLTHRMAAQNDVWFHAHGYPGSHVVLRREGRKEEPSKIALEEAAAVAAYWSKGKSAKKVPVIYTLAKYVSKPRGGAPGQALVKREKTIIVEPRVISQYVDSHK